MRRIDYGTIWVCQCCTLSHANGECCADNGHGGDGIAPWSDIDFSRYAVSMGMGREEHADGCEPGDDCDCEHNTFSASRCDGCGSYLAGARYSFTLTGK